MIPNHRLAIAHRLHCLVWQLLGYCGSDHKPVAPPPPPAAAVVTRAKAAASSASESGKAKASTPTDKLKAMRTVLLQMKDARVADVPALLEQALALCA